LKPFIDSKYRTKKGVEYTFVAGSSMGGLISLYALMQYPKVFGGAGVFSPAFWITPQMFDDAEKFVTNTPPKIYFYCGGNEGASMVPDMNKMADIFYKKSNYQIEKVTSSTAQHNEKYWRAEFPKFYVWLMH
ncbi:MAG: alpha/beta hydrolase, partial [Bacteroidota bacterium]|nr:alpha/beta hydrolase [Bacteroidota bacterium]